MTLKELIHPEADPTHQHQTAVAARLDHVLNGSEEMPNLSAVPVERMLIDGKHIKYHVLGIPSEVTSIIRAINAPEGNRQIETLDIPDREKGIPFLGGRTLEEVYGQGEGTPGQRVGLAVAGLKEILELRNRSLTAPIDGASFEVSPKGADDLSLIGLHGLEISPRLRSPSGNTMDVTRAASLVVQSVAGDFSSSAGQELIPALSEADRNPELSLGEFVTRIETSIPTEQKTTPLLQAAA